MDCPKCGHGQDDTVKCEACGVYFAKIPPPVPAPERHRPGTQPPGPRIGPGALVVTALLTAGVVIAVMRDGPTPEPPRVEAVPPPGAAEPALTRRPPAVQAASPVRRETPAWGLAAQLASNAPARNPIEAARNATVFIKTGWGVGSGFIIDADCRVITNRHVVETDGARVADKVVQDPEMRARLATAHQQLQAALHRDIRQHNGMLRQPGTNLERAQLERRIKETQARLADLPGQVTQAISARVEGAGRSGFTATLVDGTEFGALHARMSTRHDLALFTLPAANCPHIAAGGWATLAVGERLYTIGNPSGLTYTVTSGIFSGARTDGTRTFLQTDAPISPGNSGGPLITEAGRAVGINTLVLRGVPGVGFAIPIDVVYEEFPELRRTP
jgi:S1-C subfamily serine protease